MNPIENKKLKFAQDKKYIKDLQLGENAEGYYQVLNISKKTKRDGSAFLAIELKDKTGRIPAKIWDNAEHYFKILKEGDIYKIAGYVNEYMNVKEIKVDSLRTISNMDTDFDRSDFQEKAGFDTTQLFDDMMKTLRENISNPMLIRIVDLFEENFSDRFKTHYGAQKIHHAYMGGLLQHTYSIIRSAIFCAEHYPGLNKELLLIGALFHDVGKLFEFNIAPTVDVTIEGGLLGHLVIGNSKFMEIKNKIPGFPDDLSCKIQHLIISHHGEKEFGSPEVPKIPEAFVLNLLDLLDSKLKIVEESVTGVETKGLFSDYIQPLGRRLYVPPRLP